MALTDNLIAYWGFDQENVISSVGNPSYILVNEPDISYIQGKVARGISFENQARLRITENLWNVNTSPLSYSVAFWVKKMNTSTGAGAVAMGNMFGDMGFVFIVGENPNLGLIRLMLATGTGYQYSNLDYQWPNSSAVPTDEWIHLACVYDYPALTGKLFVNGQLVVTQTNVSNTRVTNANWTGFALNGSTVGTTGSEYGGSFSFDMVGLWTRTLSDEEVSELYNGGTGKDLFGGNLLVDNSTLNNIVSAVGDVTQSTSIKKYGDGSASFDGSGDYLEIPYSDAFDYLLDDFTVEFWVRLNSIDRVHGIICATINGGMDIQIGTNFLGIGNHFESWQHQFSWSPLVDTWYHVAITRESGNTKAFINGQQIDTTKNDSSKSYSMFGGNIRIGRGDGDLNGYLDDIRITKGVARYTSDFTPPQTKLISPSLSLDNNTSLLMHMDGNQGSTTFRDSSPNNFTITRNGSIRIDASTKKFGSGAAFLDGSGDYLEIPANATITGTEDFTIECWVYPVTLTPSSGYTFIYGFKNESPNGNFSFGYTTGGFLFTATAWQGIDNTANTQPLILNQWSHIALTRTGGTLRGFVNEQQCISASNNNNYPSGKVGAIGGDYGGNPYFYGYIDELRISKGIARYTANFVPQTAPFANPTPIE
jgi:hypothetical protein